MAEVEQNLVIGGPETWQRRDNSLAIFRMYRDLMEGREEVTKLGVTRHQTIPFDGILMDASETGEKI